MTGGWHEGGSCSCSCRECCVALPSTSWRACSKEAFGGEGAPLPGRPVVSCWNRVRRTISTRRRRRPTNSVAMRAERAKTLVQLGELSAARVALEGAERELTNPRRPPFPRHEVTREVADTRPAVSFTLDQDLFLISLRTSRRRAAGGPSGMTAPVLDNEADSALLAEVGSIMSQGMKILGIPVGQPGFVRRFLEKKSEEQKLLFDRIPVVPDLQSAWLILCEVGVDVAVEHDSRLCQCAGFCSVSLGKARHSGARRPHPIF